MLEIAAAVQIHLSEWTQIYSIPLPPQRISIQFDHLLQQHVSFFHPQFHYRFSRKSENMLLVKTLFFADRALCEVQFSLQENIFYD